MRKNTTQICFSHLDYNDRYRNCTGSCQKAYFINPRLADYTAGGELHPAPKLYYYDYSRRESNSIRFEMLFFHITSQNSFAISTYSCIRFARFTAEFLFQTCFATQNEKFSRKNEAEERRYTHVYQVMMWCFCRKDSFWAILVWFSSNILYTAWRICQCFLS